MFLYPEDIANRGLQVLGEPRIKTFADASKAANEMSFVYDKLRQAELRRATWNFATRRMVLRTTAQGKIVFPAYVAATTYALGDIVLDANGILWSSTIASNTGSTPGASTGLNPPWVVYHGPLYCSSYSASAQYYQGDMVINSGTVYRCFALPPVATAPPNATYFMAPASLTTVSYSVFSPVGYTPSGGTTPRKIFYLPASFMRLAPQDPHQPGNVRLNITAGMRYNDWEIEGDKLISATALDPLIFRFVADTQDVPNMDPMFCEALGSRMGADTAMEISQDPAKVTIAMDSYKWKMDEARAVGAVEGGSTEDDTITPPQQSQGGGRGRGQ